MNKTLRMSSVISVLAIANALPQTGVTLTYTTSCDTASEANRQPAPMRGGRPVQ